MSSIGDKKVALNLSDGTSVNLNKPKVLPVDVTKISSIREPGYYIGGFTDTTDNETGVLSETDTENSDATHSSALTSSEYFDDSEINYVITDGPDGTSYKQIFTLLVVPDVYYKKNSSSKDHTSGYTYWLFYNDDIYNGVMEQDDDSLSWYRLAYKGDVPAIINNLTTSSTDAGVLNASQGKVLKDLIDGLGIKTIDSTITDLAAITESGTYIGTTDFDNKIGTTGSVVYATSFLTNWPRSMIQSEGTPTGVPYVLRVTNVATGSSNNRIYYELLCAALGNQKVYGSSGGDTNNRSITWTNDITCIEDSLTSRAKKCALSANQGRVLNETKQNKPTISTTDLTAGTSSLDTDEFYFVYD